MMSRVVLRVQRSVAATRCVLGSRRPLAIAATSLRQAKHQIMVPTMGDSITEGTIVEWTVGIGEAVKEGDVVALVETDKVTVDIKADMGGVIVQTFGEVDETVEVGSKLYEIDTEAEASAVSANSSEASGSEETQSSTSPETSPSEEVVATAASAESRGRTPSIHFLGKGGWANRLAGHDTDAATSISAPDPKQPTSPKAAITLDGSSITPHYGRLPMSDKEMEALILGGAETAPSLVSPSGPAMFAPA